MSLTRQTRSLVWAGNALILTGVCQIGVVCWFSTRGGAEGVLSPAAALTIAWPLAVLLVYVGLRLRSAASGLLLDDPS
jgi:hypothetical protein